MRGRPEIPARLPPSRIAQEQSRDQDDGDKEKSGGISQPGRTADVRRGGAQLAPWAKQNDGVDQRAADQHQAL
jgi:hypothetical protein